MLLQARMLSVDEEIQPVVDFFLVQGLQQAQICQVILGRPLQ